MATRIARLALLSAVLAVGGCRSRETWEEKQARLQSAEDDARWVESARDDAILRGDQNPAQRERWDQQATTARKRANDVRKEVWGGDE